MLTASIDAEVDFLAWELRPAVLDDLGLAAALPRFLRDGRHTIGVAAEFRSAGFDTGASVARSGGDVLPHRAGSAEQRRQARARGARRRRARDAR